MTHNPLAHDLAARMSTVRYWTTSELSVLREHYPTGGCKACQERLPHRSQTSIYQQAAELGIKSQKMTRIM